MRIDRALFALSLVGILGTAPALAAAPEGESAKGKKHGFMKGKGWDTFMSRFDTNKDGKVARDEFLGQQPGFDRVDTNKDGTVTADEASAAKEAIQKHASQKGGQANKGRKNFIERFDADKDGKVSRDEFTAGRTKGFEAMDKNKDGVLEKAEFEAKAKDAAAKDAVEED
jgi:Ca2+-binding EF-hand superfamily protein